MFGDIALPTEVFLNINQLFVKGAKNQAMIILNPNLLQAMVFHVEVFRVAAFTGQATSKWHTDQITFGVKRPLMINTGKSTIRTVATDFTANHRATVGTTIDPGVNLTLGIAGDYHRGIPDEG